MFCVSEYCEHVSYAQVLSLARYSARNTLDHPYLGNSNSNKKALRDNHRRDRILLTRKRMSGTRHAGGHVPQTPRHNLKIIRNTPPPSVPALVPKNKGDSKSERSHPGLTTVQRLEHG